MKHLPWLSLLAALPSVHAWTPGDKPPAMPLDSFVLPDGLEITAWATSPELFNPTNMDFDHLGRLWVTEGVNYRGKSNRQPGGDRIVVLQDTDGDGKAEKSSVFWQDPELVCPLGIGVFDNVVMVSQPPHLLKLTDVNRDLKFDPASGDTREVFITGFNGRNHDHSLHSVTGGPDGKWYFNHGNCAGIYADKSGKTFRLGNSYYQNGGGEWPINTLAAAGQKSDDGFVYAGGATVRINPDGTGAQVIGHGYRNSYEQTITSRGDVFQNDNDDPPACRVSHVIEYGSAGFFSRDGKRMWNVDKRPGQDTPTAEWRQQDPGIMPAGDVYGGGSPTGIAFYENGALGDSFVGALLSCEPARNVIFGYKPALEGAGFGLKRLDLITTNPDKTFDGADFTGGVKKQKQISKDDAARFLFRPSDVTVGPDGALYIADWTDSRVGGHDTQDDAASGVIYRVAPKGFVSKVPAIDPATAKGAILALRSPAVNVRWLGFQTIKKSGASAYNAVVEVLADPNPYVSARAIWLLPYLGEKGIAKLAELIASPQESTRLTAFRAIRASDGAVDDLPFAKKLASDPSAAVRAETALAMRYRTFEEAREVLVTVATKYDGKDRSYLESLGLGTGHYGDALWTALSQTMNPGKPAEWTDTFARLTWRLMPASAVDSIKERAANVSLTKEQQMLAVDSLAFIDTLPSARALMDLAVEGSPVRESALWWLRNRVDGEWSQLGIRPEMQTRGLDQKASTLVGITVPGKPESTKFTVADVLALKGDAAKGKIAAARCVMCHQIDNAGPEYGPALKGFGSRQPPEIVAKSIVDPSSDISHGFEGTAIRLHNGDWIDGLVLSDEDTITIRSTGGLTQKVPKKEIAERKHMDRSLMLNADQLGLVAQDVADIVEWMKTY